MPSRYVCWAIVMFWLATTAWFVVSEGVAEASPGGAAAVLH